MLNSQFLYHRTLGFGATTTKKQEARRRRPARETRKSTNTRRGSRQDTTAQQSYLIHNQIFFLWYEEFVHNNFIFVENPSHSSWPLRVNHHEALKPLYCCCCFHMSQVAACSAERVGGAAALFKVIVSSFLDFCHFTHSLCIFLLVEPIFSNLWLCCSNYCWFDCFFRLGLHFPFLQVLV